MEVINNIIQTTLESFDFSYCIIVSILTYLICKALNDIKSIELTKWKKRLVLVAVILSTGGLYAAFGIDIKLILNSAILAPVFWSWIMKPICKVFNIDYNDKVEVE